MIFKHMPEILECRTCHSAEKTDKLNLLDGTIIRYDEMQMLCSVVSVMEKSNLNGAVACTEKL